MSEVINLGARLSSNPETKVVSHVQGANGQVNETTNGKQFYVADCLIALGAKPVKKSISIWANDKGQFDLSVAEYNKYMKDKVSEGKLVRFDDLTPYEVDGNTFTHATLLVMAGESEATILTSFVKRQSRVATPAGAGEDLGGE